MVILTNDRLIRKSSFWSKFLCLIFLCGPNADYRKMHTVSNRPNFATKFGRFDTHRSKRSRHTQNRGTSMLLFYFTENFFGISAGILGIVEPLAYSRDSYYKKYTILTRLIFQSYLHPLKFTLQD